MTAITLPNSGLAAGYIDGEAGWGAAMNRNLRVLDLLVQPRVLDKDLNAPPASPASGDAYIVGPVPTGAWATHAGKLALWQAGDDMASAWAFVTPKASWRAFVVDEAIEYRHTGVAWVADAGTFASFTADIGDGASAEFTVTHNLGTRAVHVTVYRNAAPYDEVVVDVQHTTVNSIKLVNFAVAPSLNQFNVVVSK